MHVRGNDGGGLCMEVFRRFAACLFVILKFERGRDRLGERGAAVRGQSNAIQQRTKSTASNAAPGKGAPNIRA